MTPLTGMEQRFVGGLLLIDRKQYFAMKERLEREWTETPRG